MYIFISAFVAPSEIDEIDIDNCKKNLAVYNAF